MALRARGIKPGFYRNEDLAECSVWARLLFPGLWMMADRAGRLEDRPRKIKGEVFPFDSIEVDPLLQELERWKFIVRYQVGGVGYIQITTFATHQSPHVREKASEIPAIDGSVAVDSEPVTDQGSVKASPRSCLAPPDSLTPDSLTPDSLTPENNGRAYPSTESTTSSPAQSVCARLIADGVQGVNPTNPKLLALLDAGLSVDELAAIGPEAAQKGMSFAWLLGAAEGRRRDAATVGALPGARVMPWFLLASGIEAKGAELGVDPLRDEPFPVYKTRVYAAAGISDDELRRANHDFGAKK